VIWRNSICARMIVVWRKLKIGGNPFKSIEFEVDNEARRVGG